MQPSAAGSEISYRTIAEAITGTAARWPDHGYTFQDLKGNETFYSFAEIAGETARRAGALQALGLRRGDRLGMVLIEPREFVLTFLASLRVGVIPVPFYPPLGLGNFDSYSQRIGRLLQSCEARMLFASRRLESVLWALVSEVPCLERLITEKHLEPDRPPDYPELTPDDVAFLQYTSGSTDDPKGVMITHRCLVANSEGILGPGGLQADPAKDVGVTWLPLYHDMGLIGAWLGTCYFGARLYVMSPIAFLVRPATWLWTMHKYRATFSGGPNFAFELCASRIDEADLQGLDLSSLRFVVDGAEPISPQTLRRFNERFTRYGMDKGVVSPSYGLAENCV
ncbi:MAG TPA: AMP-binding protein, partial [Thermoanaerobaculia bacterium]